MSTNVIGTELAHAATTTVGNEQTHAAASGFSSLLLLIGFLAIFYFFAIRPQMKRAKEQRELSASLNKGDEVITSGGILGKIVNISNDFVTLAIADGVEITVQKPAITATLPKGTMKSIP